MNKQLLQEFIKIFDDSMRKLGTKVFLKNRKYNFLSGMSTVTQIKY